MVPKDVRIVSVSVEQGCCHKELLIVVNSKARTIMSLQERAGGGGYEKQWTK